MTDAKKLKSIVDKFESFAIRFFIGAVLIVNSIQSWSSHWVLNVLNIISTLLALKFTYEVKWNE